MIIRLQPISEIVKQVCQASTKDDKIALLRHHDHPALREYLRLAFSPNIKWRIPEGRAPFIPCLDREIETQIGAVLYDQIRRLYIFLPGQDNISDAKRQQIFITLLESMPPSDAEFLCDVVKDHKIPEGLTLDVCKEAFRI